MPFASKTWRQLIRLGLLGLVIVPGAFTGAFLGVQWERRPSFTTPSSPWSAAPRSGALGARQFVGRPRQTSEAPAKRQALISGTGEALATVLVSEMGDKTFFLTMILAMRKSRRLALLASQSALWIMMLISTSIGVMLRRLTLTVGDALIMRVGAAVLMIFFGLQSFWELNSGDSDEEGDDKDDAHTQIQDVLTKAKKKKKSKFLDIFRFAVLIFLAEWGDRSMLATITLATTKSPFGVLVGGCCGHLVAGTLAVVAGHFLEEHVSDRVVKITGGTLFVLFGLSTLLNIW